MGVVTGSLHVLLKAEAFFTQGKPPCGCSEEAVSVSESDQFFLKSLLGIKSPDS